MAVDSGKAAYYAAGRIAQKINNMTRAELLTLDEILGVPELLKYWNYLTIEDMDEIIAILKKSAEQE